MWLPEIGLWFQTLLELAGVLADPSVEHSGLEEVPARQTAVLVGNAEQCWESSVWLGRARYSLTSPSTWVWPDYIKRLRYCEYLGKYFCQCCHENAQMIIPSRILRKWDFSKYYVSNFSKDLLSKIWSDPLFNVQDINPALYRKVKSLNQVWVRPFPHLPEWGLGEVGGCQL